MCMKTVGMEVSGTANICKKIQKEQEHINQFCSDSRRQAENRETASEKDLYFRAGNSEVRFLSFETEIR